MADEKEPETKAEEKAVEESSESKSPEMTEDEKVAAISSRLKFFFSDANIRQDSFLRKALLSPEKSMKVETLLRFNTIKQYSTEADILKKAAATLPEILKMVGEDSIGRVTEFTMDRMDDNIPLSLMVGNLPIKKEEKGKKNYDVTVDDVKKLFEGYGPVALAKLQFDVVPVGKGNKRFKKTRKQANGMALVEFENAESLEKAAEDTLTTKDEATVEPKRKLKIGETELTVVTLKEFNSTSKKRKIENDESGTSQKEIPEFTIEWKPGCVIRLEGLASTCDREKMMEAVAKGLDITVTELKDQKIYMDFSRGQTSGHIRFRTPEPVAGILAKLQSGEIEIAGAKVETVSLVEGEAEKKYWADFIAFKNEQRKKYQSNKKARTGP